MSSRAADAARIPAAGSSGRAYAWLGGGHPVAFQAACVGGIRAPAPAGRAHLTARPLHWTDLGRSPAMLGRARRMSANRPTCLFSSGPSCPPPGPSSRTVRRSPWQPPLADGYHAAPTGCPRGAGRVPGHCGCPYGLIDQPERQRQVPAVLRHRPGRSPAGGRGAAVRAEHAAAHPGRVLAAQVSPDEAHLYVFDGGRSLAALAGLPHCGAVVTAAEPDRVDRLLARLTRELTARTRLLSIGGHSDLAEYREASRRDARTPFLLVFVDRYDAFVTALENIDGGRLIQQLQRLMRDGLAAGIRVRGDRRPPAASPAAWPRWRSTRSCCGWQTAPITLWRACRAGLFP